MNQSFIEAETYNLDYQDYGDEEEEEEEKYDDLSSPEFYDRLPQHTLQDIDLTYCDEIIRIFLEKKLNDEEMSRLAKLYSNTEMNSGEQGVTVYKKKKNKNAHNL